MKHLVILLMILQMSVILLGTTTTAIPMDGYYDDRPIDYDGTVVLTDADGNMYIDGENVYEGMSYLPYSDIQKRKTSIYKYRKSCVPRGGNCDHRPKYCCNSGSCRCNLWGANCKCQRMGFFQQWGK